VIRRSIAIIALTAALSASGQKKLNGEYCTEVDYTGLCLTFTGDSLFDYRFYTCLSGERGSGIYKIDKRKLILFFSQADTTPWSKIEQYKCNDTDSVVFKIFVMYRATKEQLPFANILIKSSGDSMVGTTDLNGECSLLLRKNGEEIELTFMWIGYKKTTIRISAVECKQIQIFLEPSHNARIYYETREYKIVKIEKKKLFLLEDKYIVKLHRKSQ
jgi:hypothetical protein